MGAAAQSGCSGCWRDGKTIRVLFDRSAAGPQTSQTDDVQDAVIALDPAADAPAVARAFLTEHRDHLPAGVYDDAVLLVSELVTNAVRYGHTIIVLRVRASPPGVGVAVADTGAPIPTDITGHLTQPDPEATTGRGLAIIDALASAWGITPADPPPGKTVWFELHTGRAAPDHPQPVGRSASNAGAPAQPKPSSSDSPTG